MSKVDDLIEKHYGSLLIGQRALESTIREFLPGNGYRLLDAGCGEDAPFTRKFSSETKITGIDLCRGLPRDLSTVCGDLGQLPFTSETFSLVFSRSVFEHLVEPDEVMAEINRTLKPGGICVILTPNRYDYSSVIASLTPQWFHRWFVGRVYGPHTYDTFPTLYRANTPGYFKRLAKEKNGWKMRKVVGLRHYPANFLFSRSLFRAGIVYDWLLARLGWSALQPSLLVVLEKAA
ncbi:MAG TPA: class I SAM-dependent methyltransferase [Candidatus Binatia bacterium]|nr:class I SAM-dependent methyltransferase [Candidatus Binatia bacterium]